MAKGGSDKMGHIKKELLIDLSTRNEFRFSLCCGECGNVWKSNPICFSKAGMIPETDGKQEIYDVLYRREKKETINRAVEQVCKDFNLCPICGRLVCDRCFMVCTDLDMCVACAYRLKEKGELVAER